MKVSSGDPSKLNDIIYEYGNFSHPKSVFKILLNRVIYTWDTLIGRIDKFTDRVWS